MKRAAIFPKSPDDGGEGSEVGERGHEKHAKGADGIEDGRDDVGEEDGGDQGDPEGVAVGCAGGVADGAADQAEDQHEDNDLFAAHVGDYREMTAAGYPWASSGRLRERKSMGRSVWPVRARSARMEPMTGVNL